jgi:hypothetical protein
MLAARLVAWLRTLVLGEKPGWRAARGPSAGPAGPRMIALARRFLAWMRTLHRPAPPKFDPFGIDRRPGVRSPTEAELVGWQQELTPRRSIPDFWERRSLERGHVPRGWRFD